MKRIAFHIGEFARLVGVNKRTLHYYDERRIFSPAKVEKNGYRSYSFRQLWTFFMLRIFRAMGLELSEIEDYMEHKSPDRLYKLLTEQEEWLQNEIVRLKRQLRIVKNQRNLLKTVPSIICNEVSEVDLPAAKMVISPNVRALTVKGNWVEAETIAAEHVRYTLHEGLTAGLFFGAMVAAGDFMQKGRECVLSYYFTPTDVSTKRIAKSNLHIRPSGRFVVTYFNGDYYETSDAYDRLRDYIIAHNLEPIGYSYEESVIDDMAATDFRDFITRIAVQVIAE